VYGLALAGEAGVRDVIRNVRSEFDLTMGLSGCVRVSDITGDTVVPAGPLGL
jgi:lactate 2-monooxygenase